ncbi:MAG: hypothetical protein ABFS45_13840 [Pseudomonadota bacterium]
MSEEIKQYLVQMIGPSGLVTVNGKPQQFIEEATSQQELEKRLTKQKLDVDPVFGSSLYAGRFVGCWIHIRELPDPQESLDLEAKGKDFQVEEHGITHRRD